MELATHHSQLQTTILGVSTGALIAAVALSITLTYRGAGVINFGSAAISMFASFVFYDLRQNGAIFFPPPFGSITFVAPPKAQAFGAPAPAMSPWVALVITLVFCVVLGVAIHFLVFRPLRNAPALARVAASIGVFLFLFAIIQIRYPSGAISSNGSPVTTLLGSSIWTWGTYTIQEDFAVLAFLVIAVAIGLWALFRFTRFGIATRAAAENERGALILGLNPNRLALSNWVLSTVLAGGFGVLMATVQSGPITQEQMPFILLAGLAAALAGRFRSFPIVVAASLVFGGLEAWVQNVGSDAWFPRWLTFEGSALPGLASVVPLLVVLAVLFFRGERLPSRGSEAALRMPRASNPRTTAYVSIVGIVALASGLSFALDSSWRIALGTSVIAAVLCASLTVLTGFMGQVSLMQMTIGGFTAYVLSRFCDTHGIVFPLGPLLAAGAGMLAGLLAAVPALRIRGVNLAIATLCAALVMEEFVYSLPVWGVSYNNPASISAPSIFGVSFGPNSLKGWIPDPWFLVFCAVVLGAVLCAVVAIRRSRLGRRMLAVRSNERAAAAVGVNVTRTKFVAFAISAFIAGIGGTLYGYSIYGVDTGYFSSINSLLLIAVAYLGGIAVWEGAPISGALFQAGLLATFFANILHLNVEYAVYVAGIGLIVASINNQEGISGSIREVLTRRRRPRTPLGVVPPRAPAPVAAASGGG